MIRLRVGPLILLRTRDFYGPLDHVPERADPRDRARGPRVRACHLSVAGYRCAWRSVQGGRDGPRPRAAAASATR